MRAKNRLSHIIQGSILLFCIVLGAFLLRPLKTAADKRAEILKNELIAQLEDSLGIGIRYESISPALLSAVTIRGLKVSFESGDFTADRVRIFYNPLRRFSGNENDPVRMISRVTVNDGNLNLSITSGEDEELETDATGFDLWPLLVDKTVVLTGLSASVSLDESIAFQAVNVALQLKDDSSNLRYTFSGEFKADDIGSLQKIGEIETAVSSSGSFSPEDSEINGRLEILTAKSDFVVLEPLSVDFTMSDNELTARRVDDERPLDLAIRYTGNDWELSGEAVSLGLRDIAAPGLSTGAMDPWFSSVIDGFFNISGSIAEKSINYDMNMLLSVPSGAMPWGFEAELVCEGNNLEAQIESIKMESAWGNAQYTGSFGIDQLEPDGLFSFNLTDSLLGYPIEAVFVLKTRQGAITANPVLFEAADLEFQDFRFLIIKETDIYALSLVAVPGNPDEESNRRLTLDALLDTTAEPVVHGFISLDGFSSSHIARLAGIGNSENLPVIKDSIFDMESYFEANRDSWVVSLDNAQLTEIGHPENHVTFKGRASPENWSLDSIRVSWDDYTIDGRGFGGSSTDGGSAEGRFLIEEQIYPVHAKWYPDGKLVINGDFGMSAVLGSRTINGRSIQVLGENVAIPLNSGKLVANLDLRGMISKNDWDLYINRARLDFTERPEMSDVLAEWNGTINPGNIVLPNIRIVDDLGTLSGNAVFQSDNNGNRLQGRLFMSGIEDERYELSLNRENSFWDIGIDIQGGRLDRVKRDRISGQLNVNGRMTGTLDNPLLTLDLKTEKGLLDGQPFGAEGLATMDSGRLRVHDLHYEHEGMVLDRGLLLFNLSEGNLRSTAELRATYNQVPVSSGFSLAVDFGRSFSFAGLAEILESNYSGTLATREVLWNTDAHLPPFTFQFVRNNEGFKVRTPDNETLNVDFVFDTGELSVISGNKMPIAVTGGGTIKDGQIDLSFPAMEIDPVLINYVMIRDPILLQYHVIFQGGVFRGNLDIIGPAENPELFGEIRADKLKVDTPYTYADIKPTSTDIHLEGHKITIDRMDIPVGDGIAYGGGHIILDRGAISEFDMVYGGRATGNGGGVPVYYPLMGVNLDGTFTGEVHMTGGNRRYFLDGDLVFPNLNASLGSPIIPVIQEKNDKYPTNVFLNFNFITGNNCTFFLPNEQLKIVKATAEAGQVINLIYSKDPKNMSLIGNLPIRSGDIFYFDSNFQITEGSMIFNETLGNFDPILSIRAESKVRDDTGEDVSVALVYNAPVLSDFNPKIETVPTRSDAEIMALFGQVVVPYSETMNTDAAASTVLMATGGMFGQMGIVQPFEEVLREGLNLDMVTIRTDIIGNALAGSLARSDTAGGNTQSAGLGQYLDNTSLFAGKYIGNALFVSGTVSANYFEGQRLRSVFGGLEFETSVSLEMQTPFFNVAWSYSPDSTRTQNFVADNEISLKWQFTF